MARAGDWMSGSANRVAAGLMAGSTRGGPRFGALVRLAASAFAGALHALTFLSVSFAASAQLEVRPRTGVRPAGRARSGAAVLAVVFLVSFSPGAAGWMGG